MSIGGNLNVIGSITEPSRAISAIDTLTYADNQIIVTSGTFTIYLPSAVGHDNEVFAIKNIGTGTITIDANSTETMDGELTQEIWQWDNMVIKAYNGNWIIY